MNILIDNNIILDYYDDIRRIKYPEAVEIIDNFRNYNLFISSSSIDNLEFIKRKALKDIYGYVNKEILKMYIQDILSKFKIAKTPSYIEFDFDDIEDSQIVASAKAINAKIITRDEKLLTKYTEIALSPKQFLSLKEDKKIDFANLKKQYFMYQSELEKEMDKVLNNASFIMGDVVKELESNLCKFTNAKNSITCGSGTDALLLAMMALDIKPGDEIITTPFTFIATAETIAFLGAKPVFVDIDEITYNIDSQKIEEKITSKTKGIISVSLYGQPSDLDEINKIAKKHNLFHIVDGAQSFGATYKEKAEVHFCDIYTTSFFPAKPLGCFGDGGAVLTNKDELAEKIKILRVHGQNKRYHHKYIGMGARMDTIQCAIVNVKLKYYEKDLKLRQIVAKKYSEKLQNLDIILPTIKLDRTSAYAQYSVRVKNRDEIQVQLKENGIPTAVHYPMPLHLQECFSYLRYKQGDFPIAEKVSKEIMSLPMNPYVSEEEIEYIKKWIKND